MIYTDKKNQSHPKMVWQYIKADIEKRVIQGELQGGDKAPSIAEISEEYKVSKSTAQKVLESISKDGTFTKRKGVGYFVKPFVKEKLRQKHMEKLSILITEVKSYSNSLNIGKDELLNMLFPQLPHGEE